MKTKTKDATSKYLSGRWNYVATESYKAGCGCEGVDLIKQAVDVGVWLRG
jgi:hypothetical protein